MNFWPTLSTENFVEVDDIVGVWVESRSTLLSGFGHLRTECARVLSAVLGLLALEKMFSRPWRRGRSVSVNSTPVLRVAARATGGSYFWAARTRRPRPGRTHTYWVCSSVLVAKTGGGVDVWRLSWTLRTRRSAFFLEEGAHGTRKKASQKTQFGYWALHSRAYAYVGAHHGKTTRVWHGRQLEAGNLNLMKHATGSLSAKRCGRWKRSRLAETAADHGTRVPPRCPPVCSQGVKRVEPDERDGPSARSDEGILGVNLRLPSP